MALSFFISLFVTYTDIANRQTTNIFFGFLGIHSSDAREKEEKEKKKKEKEEKEKKEKKRKRRKREKTQAFLVAPQKGSFVGWLVILPEGTGSRHG